MGLINKIKDICLCRQMNWVLLVILVGYLIFRIINLNPSGLEFIPQDGLINHQRVRVIDSDPGINQVGGGNEHGHVRSRNEHGHVRSRNEHGHVRSRNEHGHVSQLGGGLGGSVDASSLKSITQDQNLALNPDGGDNICRIISGSSPSDFQCQFADPTLCSLTREDQNSLAIAIKTSGCFRAQRGNQLGSGPYGKTIDPERIAKPGCLPCRAKEDWNYVSQTGSGITNNNILYPTDPRNPNASELNSQFYRDVQNQLAEHSVENYRFPSWSTLTSSYRNDPQYCGLGTTVHEIVSNDHCFDPDEYHSVQQLKGQKSGVPRDVPSVINTQIANKNRRLRSQIVYSPVRTSAEIIPYNGFLDEKPANFTSEHTRTFDFFTHANLGHVDSLR